MDKGGYNIDKSVKILVILCFILVAGLAISIGVILHGNSIHNNTTVSAVNQTNNVTPPQENVTKPNSASKTTNNNVISYQGQKYKIITKELTPLGPHEVECPYCGADASQVGSSVKGRYWYYYYHCGVCGANIAQRTLNS